MANNQICKSEKIDDVPYTDEGVKAIASAISVSASLTSINLRGNNIGDEGAKYVAKGIAVCASLTSIDLSWNRIGNEGAKHIAESIAVSASLTSIDLNDNWLTDRGAKHIAEGIAVSASLTEIDLCDNPFCGFEFGLLLGSYDANRIKAISVSLTDRCTRCSAKCRRRQGSNSRE